MNNKAVIKLIPMTTANINILNTDLILQGLEVKDYSLIDLTTDQNIDEPFMNMDKQDKWQFSYFYTLFKL